LFYKRGLQKEREKGWRKDVKERWKIKQPFMFPSLGGESKPGCTKDGRKYLIRKLHDM
jgi:hypothetical protein